MFKKCVQRGLASCGLELYCYIGPAAFPLRGARDGGRLGSMAEAIANALSRLGSIKWLRLTSSPWRYSLSDPRCCSANLCQMIHNVARCRWFNTVEELFSLRGDVILRTVAGRGMGL